jgi:hypothetical protein
METPEKKEESQTNQDVNKEGTEKEPEIDKYSDNEKQLYARAKNAEKELKDLKVKFKELDKKPETPEKKEENKEQKKEEPLDALKIARLANTLKEYDEVELSYIELMSKAKGKSLEEIVKDEDVQLYIDAKREKNKKDNMGTTPNGKQVHTEKTNPFAEKFSKNLPKGFDYTK